ncbi:MAG: hypothetical protein KC731_30425, partial [Myxococcales bacterium]|nr:hypothetical protein [Myxococcales bacterium]
VDDGNACTVEICEVGEPHHEPKPAGSRCGGDGVCNGAGRCGVCVPGVARCQGPAVETCDAEGQFAAPQACGLGAPRCSDARCVAIAELALAPDHGCLRFEDGATFCFGEDGAGQLGGEGLPGAGDQPWPPELQGAAVGPHHACGLDSAGQARCWGSGRFGQLVTGLDDADEPRSVDTPPLTAIVVGRDHSCGLGRDGVVRCWGRNDRGQLGRGKASGAPLASGAPVEGGPLAPLALVPGLVATRLDLGRGFSCAQVADGRMRCWGVLDLSPPEPLAAPDAKRLKRASEVEPGAVAKLGKAVAIAAAGDRTCALDGAGAVSCWGASFEASGAPSFAAVGVSLRPAVSLGLGQDFGCTLGRDGAVQCWGAGPVRDIPLPPTRSLAVSDRFACALGRDGGLRCWGGHPFGEQGPQPRTVAFP